MAPRTAQLLVGRLDVADAHLTEALTIYRKVLTAGHDDLILPLNSLAMIRLAHSDAVIAEPLLDEAIEIARSRKHWMLNQLLVNRAEVLMLNGHLDQARQALDEARGAMQTLYSDKLSASEAWRAAVFDVSLARVEALSGNVVRARSLLAAAMPVLEARFGAAGFYTTRARERLERLDDRAGGTAPYPPRASR